MVRVAPQRLNWEQPRARVARGGDAATAESALEHQAEEEVREDESEGREADEEAADHIHRQMPAPTAVAARPDRALAPSPADRRARGPPVSGRNPDVRTATHGDRQRAVVHLGAPSDSQTSSATHVAAPPAVRTSRTPAAIRGPPLSPPSSRGHAPHGGNATELADARVTASVVVCEVAASRSDLPVRLSVRTLEMSSL